MQITHLDNKHVSLEVQGREIYLVEHDGYLAVFVNGERSADVPFSLQRPT